MHGSVLIELSHNLSSGGYVYDLVTLGQAMTECDSAPLLGLSPLRPYKTPQSTKSPASLDRPIGAIFECLIGSKRPVYTSQLQYSVQVATSSYTVQSKYMLVYPGSYM